MMFNNSSLTVPVLRPGVCTTDDSPIHHHNQGHQLFNRSITEPLFSNYTRSQQRNSNDIKLKARQRQNTTFDEAEKARWSKNFGVHRQPTIFNDSSFTVPVLGPEVCAIDRGPKNSSGSTDNQRYSTTAPSLSTSWGQKSAQSIDDSPIPNQGHLSTAFQTSTKIRKAQTNASPNSYSSIERPDVGKY